MFSYVFYNLFRENFSQQNVRRSALVFYFTSARRNLSDENCSSNRQDAYSGIALNTSKQEIVHLLNVVDRDLSDASSTSISADRRHAIAYNAALQLATIVLHASGYRAKSKIGQHWITLMLIPEIMGKTKRELSRYFNTCREKRNMTDYDLAGHISEQEVKELIKEVKKFRSDVLEWLKLNHPLYSP